MTIINKKISKIDVIVSLSSKQSMLSHSIQFEGSKLVDTRLTVSLFSEIENDNALPAEKIKIIYISGVPSSEKE